MTNRKISREQTQTISIRRQAERELRERESAVYPCYDLFDYSRGLRLNARHLLWHLDTKLCKLSEEARQTNRNDFRQEDAAFLQLNNPEACIRFQRYFAAVMNLYTNRHHCHFLTLAPMRFCISLREARKFDFKKRLLPWVRQMLRGLDYIGFVDVACYSNFNREALRGPLLSFHVHLVVRGATRTKLDALVARINEKYPAFIPGCEAAHVEDIEPGTVHRLAAYMCKGPTGDYRVWAKKGEVVDEWGEIYETVTGYKQWKRQFATPGLQLRVRDAVRHIHLDDMLVAGGSGVEQIDLIKHHTRSGMPHSMRRQRERLHSGKLPDRPLYTSDTGWLSDFTYDVKRDSDRRSMKRPWNFDPLAQIIERMAR